MMPGSGVGTGKEAWWIQGWVPELVTAMHRGGSCESLRSLKNKCQDVALVCWLHPLLVEAAPGC